MCFALLFHKYIYFNGFLFPQRHFCVFALSVPTKDSLVAIYSSILIQHMQLNNYNSLLQRYCTNLVQGAIAFQSKMMSSFLPTAIKFHYIFNLRDMSNIFQVIQE